MRAVIISSIFLFAICAAGCSKEKTEEEDRQQETQFTFRVKKNGVNWKANSAAGYYNKQDSSYYVVGIGENGEHLGFNFKRTPQFIGKLSEFNTGVMIPSCPFCASLSARYTLDSSKSNKLEIIGFDNLQHRINGRFNIHLKRERLYENEEFDEELSHYEGLFSITYEDAGLQRSDNVNK